MENKSDYQATDRAVKFNETYTVAPNEVLDFNPDYYPEVLKEIRILKSRLLDVPSLHRVEIIISFFKTHSIKTAWVLENPALTKLVVSGECKTSALESLFESFKDRNVLLGHLEQYIDDRLK